MENRKKAFGRRTIALSVIITGWALCSYLVFRYTQIRNNTGSTSDLCKTIFGSSCDKALSSIIAWHLGHPLVFWGFIYFGLLAVLFSFRNWLLDRLVILIAAFGVGISVILTALLLRGSVSCPMCLTIHFINLLTLLALFLGFRSSTSRNQTQPAIIKSPYLKWASLLLVVIVAGGFSEVGILKSAFIPKLPTVNLGEAAKKFQGEKVYDIPKSALSPHLGSVEAPVQLVVFSSFQCPACQGFASILEDINKKFGKNIGITFKNFPLSTKCNPALSEDMQPQSCDAAFAAIAANRQNRFWSYHDQLFESNLTEDEQTLTGIAKTIGLNMEKWQADRRSMETQQLLLDDIKTAYTIGIHATPSVFINGRAVKSYSEDVLNLLIQQELDKAPR